MNTIPLKWAVEITSLQDAERLEKLFPSNDKLDVKSYNERLEIFYQTYSDHTKGFCYSIDGELFTWGNKNSFIRKGYTIYTITELGTILNER